MNEDEILIFVTEGPSQEEQIITRIQRILNNRGKKRKIVILPFRTSIYGFWKEMKKDTNQDAIEVLINSSTGDSSRLRDIDPDQIAGIYLFFDYDGHCTNADDDKIIELLEFFNEETDRGKLFISYPMIEAFRDLKKYEHLCGNRCNIPISSLKGYKGISSARSDFTSIEDIDDDEILHIINENLKKMNCIFNYDYEKPSFREVRSISQEDLFTQQKARFIDRDASVGIISSIPIFLIDYFNEEYYLSLGESIYTCSSSPKCTR